MKNDDIMILIYIKLTGYVKSTYYMRLYPACLCYQLMPKMGTHMWSLSFIQTNTQSVQASLPSIRFSQLLKE